MRHRSVLARSSRAVAAIVIGIVVGAMVLTGCSSGSKAPPATTTTTTPPPTTPPPMLIVSPPTAPVGTVINMQVTGATPSESITFTITSPTGKTFAGSPHVVDATGSTGATYNSTGDEIGGHTVQAVGTGGTVLTATFTLTAS